MAGLGANALADRLMAPAFLILFGVVVIFGNYVNYKDIGWAKDNWKGHSSKTYRRGTYTGGYIFLYLVGVALLAGGVVLFLRGGK